MIFVNDENIIGGKGFTVQVMDEIRPKLRQYFGADSEQMQDFDNEVNFFYALHLEYLETKDFNFVAQAIMTADLDKNTKIDLVELLKSDPRYSPLN